MCLNGELSPSVVDISRRLSPNESDRFNGTTRCSDYTPPPPSRHNPYNWPFAISISTPPQSQFTGKVTMKKANQVIRLSDGPSLPGHPSGGIRQLFKRHLITNAKQIVHSALPPTQPPHRPDWRTMVHSMRSANHRPLAN